MALRRPRRTTMMRKGLWFLGIWSITATVACIVGVSLPKAVFWLIETIGIYPYLVLISLPMAVTIYYLSLD
jgi:hypothetical protein